MKKRTWTYDQADLYRVVMPKAVVGFLAVGPKVVEWADYIKVAVRQSGQNLELLIEILESEWGASIEKVVANHGNNG